MVKTYVVVPVFKRLELTKDLYDSLNKQIDNLEFIVVDDDPILDNYNYFKSDKLSNCTALKTNGDKWWCGTTYEGLDYLLKKIDIHDDDVVVIANNDVTLPDGEWSTINSFIKDDCMIHPRTFTSDYKEISSGSRVISWFPFITKHPVGKNLAQLEGIDLCTARLLVLNYKVLKIVGNISLNLKQYQGDNDFSLRAKSKGVSTYILTESKCIVSDNDSDLRSNQIDTFRKLYISFSAIRSSNNLKYRFEFLNNHFSKFNALLILSSMMFNIFVKFVSRKLFTK
jgi:GT2 family glycosyltransferase